MNKNDCDNIGWILADAYSTQYEDPHRIINEICTLYPKVKEEFLAYSENRIRSEKINKRQTEILTNKFGVNYAIKKVCTLEEWENARKIAEQNLLDEEELLDEDC